MSTRCAIYARFSTDRQSANSAEDQVRICRERAEREGWRIVDVYTDLAISGTSNRRPGMTAMLADAAAGSFDIVVAEGLDRIARNQADIATIFQALEFAQVRIETLSEGPISELHIGLKGTMSALFLKDLADKIRRGQRGSVARGFIPGGLCYGYDVVHELDAKGEPIRGKRRINEEQAEVVRRVHREYVAGRSPKMIAHGLNKDGIPSARGGEWRANAIVGSRTRMIGILHNPIYVGRYAHNRVRMVRDPASRKRISRPNEAADLQFVDIPDLRIVDEDLWQASQAARLNRAAAPLVYRKRPKTLLSGLIHCGICDGKFTMIDRGKFGCSRHRESGTCTNGARIRAVELEERVLVGLDEQLLSHEAFQLLEREYIEARQRHASQGAQDRAKLQRRLQAAEAAVARLVAAIADGGRDYADIRDALAAKTEERDRAREELEEDAAAPVIALHPQIAVAYRARIRGLRESLAKGEVHNETVAGQIRELIHAIYVKPGADDVCEVEVFCSLQSAVALATGTGPNRRGTRAVTLVAEDRYQRNRRGRSIKT